MPFRTTLTGGYTPSEIHTDMHGSNYTPAMAGRPVIYCHGLGASSGFLALRVIREDLAHHAYRGMVITAPLLAGSATWGNAASVSAVDAVITYLGTEYGANTDRVLFVADSHGAAVALNWAVRNPTRLGGAVLRVPAFSLQTIHDDDTFGFAAGMEAAYTNLAGLVAAYPTRDALHPTFIANLLTLDIVDRLRVMYNANDNIIPSGPQVAFGEATGVETIDMGGPDHSPWGLFHIQEQYEWLRSRAEMS